MIERIKNKEEKLDTMLDIIKRLEKSLEDFENSQNTMKELNEYYGSKEWFEDKEAFETGKIERVKAGVLTEDAVWNLSIDMKELIERMNEISNKLLNKTN